MSNAVNQPYDYSRAVKGESHYLAKLTAPIVRQLRLLHKGGASVRGMARSLGLSEATVRDAVKGKTWKHVR